MTDETSNLVLELLRAMRGDMDALRGEMRSEFAAVRERIQAVETGLRGVTYIMTASIGSLLGEVQDHEARIARLEAFRP